MSKNTNLHQAKSARCDEFFTKKECIEAEIKYYWNHFKGKIVYCNCDDPYESEFFKYFMIRFEMLGLKGLYATCYEGSQMSQHQLQLFEDEEYKGIPYKIEIYQEDIDQLKEEHDGTLSQETIKLYIKKHKKAKRLKGNGSFDSPECLKLLEKADIVVTNEPFSLFRHFLSILVEYKKDFLIIGNMNAITYKEVFPLIKENKMWLGYTRPKEFIEPNGNIKKFGNITWFTNLDIPKRHDDLILWKKYSPDEYPHYDNYDAINVDKVAEIPCDYCESWGLYPEEFETLDKTQWEEVRREPKDDTELIYVIPAKNTELRQALHEHAEGYKEKIEAELANVIYCNGVIGVPITYVDKANSKQFEILEGDDYRKKTLDSIPEECHPVKNQEPRTKNSWSCTSYHDSKESNLPPYPYQKDIVTELLELQSHSSISGVQNNSNYLELQNQKEQDLATDYGTQTQKLHNHSLEPIENTNDCLSKRYCSGCIGVPITVLDKYNPEQLEIVKFRKGNDEKDLTYTTGVTHLSNKQQATSNKQQATSNKQQATSRLHRTSEFWSARYCNGIIGVPITFLDKWSTEQFRIITMSTMSGRSANYWSMLNGKSKYSRIFISKIL